MRLRVLGHYSSSQGSYEPGQILDLSEEQAALLRRDSPGTFEVIYARTNETTGTDADAAPDAPSDADAAPEIAAMSTETATGLVVPDRRMRGGRKRRADGGR